MSMEKDFEHKPAKEQDQDKVGPSVKELIAAIASHNTLEEEMALGEALFRLGQVRDPGTAGMSSVYLKHARSEAEMVALPDAQSIATVHLELTSWYGIYERTPAAPEDD